MVLADKSISQKAGILIRRYSGLYVADALVAATAIGKKIPLCTFNKKHFEKISGLKLLDMDSS